MKNLRLLLVMLIATPIILFVGGCTEPTHHPKSTGVVLDGNSGNISLKDVKIDGCQYFMYEGGKRFGITHKGNCKNHGDEKEF